MQIAISETVGRSGLLARNAVRVPPCASNKSPVRSLVRAQLAQLRSFNFPNSLICAAGSSVSKPVVSACSKTSAALALSPRRSSPRRSCTRGLEPSCATHIDARRRSGYRSRSHAKRQAEGRALLDRRLGRPDARQGRGRAFDRLARDPVGGRAFADRSRRHGDDLFRGAGVRQAGGCGASLWARQGRERLGAGGDGALVPAVGRGDLGGAAAIGGRRARGRGDAVVVRGDRRLDRGRFLSRPRALPGRRRDRERGARGGCAAFRLRHVVLGRGAGRTRRRRARLCLGGRRRGRHRGAVHLHRRLAARPPHHRDPDRHRAGGRRRPRSPRSWRGCRAWSRSSGCGCGRRAACSSSI